MLLKEEKIEHESGEDSLKGTTEPTTLRPIVSPFLPTTPQVTRFKLKKKRKKTDNHATECKRGSKKRSKRLKLSVLFFFLSSFFSHYCLCFRSSSNTTLSLLDKLTRVVNIVMCCENNGRFSAGMYHMLLNKANSPVLQE